MLLKNFYFTKSKLLLEMNNLKMTFTQNPLRISFLSLVLLSMVLFTSCTQKEETAEMQNAMLSGQELYKSVFFADGEFATNIKSYESSINAISSLTANQKKQFDKDVAELLSVIEKDSPDFFDNFKTAMLSKDHREIEKALMDGGEKMFMSLQVTNSNVDEVVEKIQADFASGVISTDGKIDQEKLDGQTQEYQDLLNQNMVSAEDEVEALPCTFALTCVLAVALAIHNTVAITSALAVAITLATWLAITFSEQPNVDTPLAFEMLVHEIAMIP